MPPTHRSVVVVLSGGLTLSLAACSGTDAPPTTTTPLASPPVEATDGDTVEAGEQKKVEVGTSGRSNRRYSSNPPPRRVERATKVIRVSEDLEAVAVVLKCAEGGIVRQTIDNGRAVFADAPLEGMCQVQLEGGAARRAFVSSKAREVSCQANGDRLVCHEVTQAGTVPD